MPFRSRPVAGGMSSGRRQEVDDGVEHRLDALVLEGRAVQHRHEAEADRALADGAVDVLDGELLVGEVLLHEVVVLGGHDVEQLGPPLLGLGLQLGRDRDLLPLLALALVPDLCRHGDEVDDAAVVALGADRDLHDSRGRLQAVLDHLDRAEEVGTDPVHLVDEADARHPVLVGLTPHGLGLRLHAGDGVEDGDRAVEDPQRALDLDREVDVTGGVDDVDAMVPPDAGGGSRRDGDAALLLLHHPVHLGRALVDLADLVGLAGVVEDALGRGRLARVDVGHDPDVPGSLERELTLRHLPSLLRLAAGGHADDRPKPVVTQHQDNVGRGRTVPRGRGSRPADRPLG